MWIGAAILGVVAAFAVFMATALGGIGDSDRDARVAMPGKTVVTLAPGEYGVWYEEPHGTFNDAIFEPPDGIRVRVRAVDDVPQPKLDLGGLGNQVGTDNRTAETIGSLEVERKGRYRLSAGDPPSSRAFITLGDTGSGAFLRGARNAALAFGGVVLLAVLLRLTIGRRRKIEA